MRVYQMNPVQDADPQSHEGFGEIDHLLSLRCDGEAGHRQVRFLLRDTNRQSGLATRTNITVGTTSDAVREGRTPACSQW